MTDFNCVLSQAAQDTRALFERALPTLKASEYLSFAFRQGCSGDSAAILVVLERLGHTRYGGKVNQRAREIFENIRDAAPEKNPYVQAVWEKRVPLNDLGL